MPYQIKEKKNKKFSVVNSDTGKVMSKSTTETKAKKQIKSIYANMKPEHRIRHRIGMMDGLGIHDPVHRGVINEVKKILKKEEIHGNGFWSWFNFMDPKEHPILSLVLGGTKPEMVVEAVKDYGMDAITALMDPVLFPFAVASAIHNTKQEPAPTMKSAPQEDPYAYDDDDYRDYDDEDEDEYEDDGVMEDNAGDTINFQNIKNEKEISKEIKEITKNELPKEKQIEQLDKLVEHIQEQHEHPEFVDDALRFPAVYDYDPSKKPMLLQAWLLSNGVAGKEFSKQEFGNTYKNQQPYNFLNFPINGGKLGKIDYSSVGYSKF
jgi:hypothetical protein